MEPEYLTLFTNTGNFTIQVRFKNSYSSVATQKMKADEIKNLLNLDGESFISKMRFDDHLAEIEKIRDEGTLEELILPVDRVFEGKTKLTVVPEAFRFLQNGNRLNDGNFTDVPEKIADIVKGVSEGCLQSEAALIGGETAEHPGLMPEEDYDLAGFAVGVCDKKDMITGKDLNVGDVLIGLPSTGVHSNGFSLVRNVFDITEESLNTYYDELGKTLGEALLAPTKIYVKALKHIKASGITLKACSHITGGGFYENVPRMLKDGMGVEIDTKAFPKPPIFDLIQKNGDISTKEMYNVFNMGLGFVMAVDPADVEKVQAALNEINEPSYVVGKVTETGQVDVQW